MKKFYLSLLTLLGKIMATFFLVLALTLPSAAAPLDVLMKIKQAATNMSFVGIFVYSHNFEIEVMEVVRRVRGGKMHERLYALNGEPREIIRNDTEIWCYIPDKNIGIHESRQISGSGFPQILPNDLDKLSTLYTFQSGANARIAGRSAQEIKISPRDGFRYGYSLWADNETGLLLRTDLIDEHNKTVEQYMFITIDINPVITDQQLAATTKTDDLTWYREGPAKSTSIKQSSQWVIDSLPSGFEIVKFIKRVRPMNKQIVEHIVLTDGLSSVSIFIKKVQKEQGTMLGLSRMGGVHTFRKNINGHNITVIGEVPAKMVKYLANNIHYNG